MNLKHLSFVMLVLQNTALSIVSKYSRHSTGPKYRPGTAVLLVETLKFLICFAMVLRIKKNNLGAAARTLRVEVFADKPGLVKMAVLAFLYALQNIFALFAYDYVDVATYQIVYQLKIITTAMFMIVLLNRRFSAVQWAAMLALMVGVAICSYSRLPESTAADAADPHASALNSARLMGVGVVLGLAVNSGLAAAYFERVMKSHKSNATVQTIDPLWTRNLQLSAISVAVTSVDLVRNAGEVWANGLFHGFHATVFAVIFLQAVGGLTIAAVVRYSDNIVKNFGTSFSLIFSCVISNYMFDQSAPWSFYLGVFLVVGAVFVYGDSRFAVQAPPPSPRRHKRSADELPRQAHEITIETKSALPAHSGRHFTARSFTSVSSMSA